MDWTFRRSNSDGGRDFSHPSKDQPWGAHLSSYTMGIGSLPGVKWPKGGVDHPPPPSAEVEGRVELYVFPPMGLRDQFWGKLYLYLVHNVDS
jgi:hypothetical protein